MNKVREIRPRILANPRTHCEDCGVLLTSTNAYRVTGATTFRSRCRPCYLVHTNAARRAREEIRRGPRSRGVCDICGCPETATRGGAVRLLTRDHDHETGEWRGLLCSACNLAIGLLRDDPQLLRAAADYLEAPPGLGAAPAASEAAHA